MKPSSDLIAAALGEGLDLAGICDAQPPPHLEAYREWVKAGNAGAMAYLARHAEAKSDPRNLLPEAKSILMVALNYNQNSLHRSGFPRIARYALGRDYHKVVRAKLRRVIRRFEGTHPGLQWRICVDSAPLMERDFAQLAGIGWFGKNTMIINSRKGSWFVLGALLLSERFEASKPAEGGCGTCTACIEACPTGAIRFENGRWSVDGRTCISALTIETKGDIPGNLRNGIGDWTFGCDVCQEVCPFNAARASQPERAQPTSEPGFLSIRRWPSLSEIQNLSAEEWDALTAGSPVRRAGLAGLRRNASINLENLPLAKSSPAPEDFR